MKQLSWALQHENMNFNKAYPTLVMCGSLVLSFMMNTDWIVWRSTHTSTDLGLWGRGVDGAWGSGTRRSERSRT